MYQDLSLFSARVREFISFCGDPSLGALPADGLRARGAQVDDVAVYETVAERPADDVLEAALPADTPLLALALTAAGQPRHPLYAPAAAQPLRLLHPGDVLRFAAPP